MRKIFPLLSAVVFLTFQAFAQLSLNSSPSRVIGHPRLQLTTAEPNLVEGRELQRPQAVTVDTSGGGLGAVYVADTLNNRVLVWKNSASFGNGVRADAVIGQTDLYSTLAKTGSGLNAPTGVAVDSQGNLYVADSANNRIVRFPKPLSQPGDTKLADMVIGQTSLTGSSSNAGGVSATSFSSYVSGAVYNVGIAFDQAGNLWASDSANNRILRYPVAALRTGVNAPAADIVLGQPDFTTNKLAQVDKGVDARTSKDIVYQPSGMAFDQGGRLYVADGLARVLVFTPSFFMGQKTARIIGVKPNQLPPMPISNASLGSWPDAQHMASPDGVFAVGDDVFVVDSPNHRILQYDPFSQWPLETAQFSPLAKHVYGQENYTASKPNRGGVEAGANSFNNPTCAFAASGNIFIADTGNNRVLAFRGSSLELAAAVLGQDDFALNAPNLIEGREFYFHAGFTRVSGVNAILGEGVGMAVDTRSNPPALWAADPYNNRVLGFRDVRKVRPGDKADIVIGQDFSQQFNRAFINYPFNDPDVRNETGLYRPVAVAVDPFGDVWVADAGNARVLRFPKPFANISGSQKANLVIGQPSFTTKLSTDPTIGNLAHPVGLAFASGGHLVVSDSQHNRVLFYERPAGGDFTNGQPATKVFGQPDFNTATANVGNPTSGMAFPHGVAVDIDDRLYVADTGNNRVQVFDFVVSQPQTGGFAAFMLTGVNSPHGVAVSGIGGEIWVADTGNNRVVRYPSYFKLASGGAIEASVTANFPLGLTVDGFGNVLVAEYVNRVSLYFPGLVATNAATGAARPLAPNQIASLWPRGTGFSFGEATAVAPDSTNLPFQLGDVMVTMNDKPVPLYFVSPGQINFVVPMANPESGFSELQVVRPSTQQIIAATSFSFAPANPGLYTSNQTGSGQIAALNQDYSVNSAANPEARARVIQLYGTGQGFVPNAPPDGTGAQSALATPMAPTIYMGGLAVPSQNVQYSGLTSFPGLWQINVKIPDNVVPSNTVQVVVFMRGLGSNVGVDPGKLLTATIAVR